MKYDLAYSVFRPENELKAGVMIVHGMSEHRKRYDGFAQYLADRGYGVVTYDLPGHGESKGETLGWFGETGGWDTLVDSVSDAFDRLKTEFPDVPYVLFGHSMGTIVGRCWLQKHDHDIDACILSGAPNYQPAARIGTVLGKVLAAKNGKKGHSSVMDQMVTGNFNKSVKDPRTPLDWLSFSVENVDKYIQDPLCGFPFTIQGYIDELTGLQQMSVSKDYCCIKPLLPIYFFAGEQDPCIGGVKGLQSSVETLRKAGYSNVSYKLYPNMRHETLNEADHDIVYKDVADWLDKTFKVN